MQRTGPAWITQLCDAPGERRSNYRASPAYGVLASSSFGPQSTLLAAASDRHGRWLRAGAMCSYFQASGS